MDENETVGEIVAEDAMTESRKDERDDSVDDVSPTDPAFELRKRKAEGLKGLIEHRQFQANGLECRSLEDGTIRMSGIASATEVPYPVGDFEEVIRRNAFKRTLSENPDVVLLYGHEGMPLARTRAGSLALQENATGLQWTADLDPEDPDSRALARKVESGLIDQCSFAFQVTDQEWSDDFSVRSIKGVSIHRGDVSLVAMGANEATSVAVLRSADGAFELRAGKAISAANQTALQGVLDRLARADVEIDAALVEQSAVLGVENPDADADDDTKPDAEDDAARSAEPPAPIPLPDYSTRAHERLARLRRAC